MSHFLMSHWGLSSFPFSLFLCLEESRIPTARCFLDPQTPKFDLKLLPHHIQTIYSRPQPFTSVQMTIIGEVTIHRFYKKHLPLFFRHCGQQVKECGKAAWLAPSTEFITIHSPSLEFCQNTVAWFNTQTEMPMRQHFVWFKEDILLDSNTFIDKGFKYIYWQTRGCF